MRRRGFVVSVVIMCAFGAGMANATTLHVEQDPAVPRATSRSDFARSMHIVADIARTSGSLRSHPAGLRCGKASPARLA